MTRDRTRSEAAKSRTMTRRTARRVKSALIFAEIAFGARPFGA